MFYQVFIDSFIEDEDNSMTDLYLIKVTKEQVC